MLIKPPESKLYLLKHCNIVHDAMTAALLLSRLDSPQGRGYHPLPDHPELDRTALYSSPLQSVGTASLDQHRRCSQQISTNGSQPCENCSINTAILMR